MEKKEFYKHRLPNFQLPGKAYFVTWILKDVIPPHALKRYTDRLAILKSKIDSGCGGLQPPNETRLKIASPETEKPEMNNSLADAADSGCGGLNPPKISRMQSAPPENMSPEFKTLINEYRSLRKKYIKAYDDLLVVTKIGNVDLTKPEIAGIIIDALNYWEGKKLESEAFCIMPNHVHWVFKVNETDEDRKPVYLQDIMHSVKRQTAN